MSKELKEKTKPVTKKLQKFINSIAIIGNSNIPNDDGKIYYSKVDGAYLTRVGMENDLNFLLKRGITEQIQDGYGKSKTCCIGFNPIEQKWYGWSHRAIFGFGIGDECKQGDCGFQPKNKEEFAESCLRFWGDTDMNGDTYKTNQSVREEVQNGELGVYVEYTYDDKVPNESMRGKLNGVFSPYPKTWGKGQWTAKTIDDAKQMAIDFARCVS
jgi:hypothetical protein